MKKIISIALVLSMCCNAALCTEISTEENNTSNIIQNTETQILQEDSADEVSQDEVSTEETSEEELLSDNNNEVESSIELSTTYKKLNKKEYKRTTVFKHYAPYEITFKHNNPEPYIMTTNTEIVFVKGDGSTINSDSRRDIYLKSRKRDRGRHYALQVPGVILGTVVSLGTFLLGTPVGYGIYKAMQYPTVKAARTNVNISQDLYASHGLPLRFEPNIEYSLYLYPPKDTNIKSVIIKNVSLNGNICDIEIPLTMGL